MIDYDTLVKLGWTALIGWNLKETVALGKKVVALETKLENGVATTVKATRDEVRELSAKLLSHIENEEERIMDALRAPRRRKKGESE